MVSVTQILEQFPEKELIAWQLRDPKKAKQLSEEALRVGDVVDRRIHTEYQGRPQDTFETLSSSEQAAVTSCWQGWQMFKADHPDFVPSILWMQQELSRLAIIGHPDWYLKRSSRFGVCDLKCASQIRPIHWTQVAAYSWLLGDEVNLGLLSILRLDKVRGTYEYVELTDPDQIDYEIQIWLCYKQLYQHRERVKERAITMKEQEAFDVS